MRTSHSSRSTVSSNARQSCANYVSPAPIPQHMAGSSGDGLAKQDPAVATQWNDEQSLPNSQQGRVYGEEPCEDVVTTAIRVILSIFGSLHILYSERELEILSTNCGLVNQPSLRLVGWISQMAEGNSVE